LFSNIPEINSRKFSYSLNVDEGKLK